MAHKSYLHPSLTTMLILSWTVIVMLSSSSTLLARPLDSAPTLQSRLKVDEDSSDCWGSLLQLQACTGEVIQFFYNGETQLGPNCCKAIHVIEHNCWPAMISSLGFTSEEDAILRGYCDAEEEEEEEGEDSASSPSPSPVIVPLTAINHLLSPSQETEA
ncbi:hypothetical protein Dimus_013941 [Dionaea muscipula]